MNRQRTTRWGGSTVTLSAIGVAVVAVAAAAIWIGTDPVEGDRTTRLDRFVVERGSFEISVPASGELAARNQIEIRNRLESRAVITKIVDEGTFVRKGEVLVTFAKDEIEDRIQDAEDDVNNAETALVTAQSNLDIKISAQQSELDRANLDVMLAELALEAWQEGEVKSRRQQLQLELQTAQMDYDRLHDKYEESKKLVEKQFLSQDEFRMDEIRMIEASARLEQAKLDIQVYENYEIKEEQARKESDVEQAKAERDRIVERHKAELETARREVASKQHNLNSRQQRLDDLREELKLCTVTAPSDGLVVYPSSLEQHRWSRGDRGDLQVGAEVRKNELVMILPDTSEMTAEVKVNESLSGLIDPGQRAVITSDAMPEVALHGVVDSIGVLAESGGWRDPNRRDYTVKILLADGNDLGLKPSMRCKAEIYVGEVADALFVPLQAIFREGSAAFVYVPQGAGFAQKRVAVGEHSGLHVEIIDGLDEGDVVLLREPKPREVVARLSPEETAPVQAGTAANAGPRRRPDRGDAEQDGNRDAWARRQRDGAAKETAGSGSAETKGST